MMKDVQQCYFNIGIIILFKVLIFLLYICHSYYLFLFVKCLHIYIFFLVVVLVASLHQTFCIFIFTIFLLMFILSQVPEICFMILVSVHYN